MFAPQSSPAPRFENQHPKTKDVVFCERSAFPLAVPSALVASIWDQVNEGVRSVPRGGAEVGGLLLGRQSQSGIVLAEEVIPIQIEYRFGPSFRLSDLDLNNIRSLMASVQKDPSKAVVGLFRSRTRNDSRTQESDSELLTVLEQAHTSFSANFHYYVAFTPLTKLSMTASVSVRKEDGWEDWQHMTLRSNPMSATDPIEFEIPPKDPQPVAQAPSLESALPRTSVAPPLVPRPEPPHSEPHHPPQASVRPAARQENRGMSDAEFMAAVAAAAEQPSVSAVNRNPKLAWYVGGAALLGAIALTLYLRSSAQPTPHITFTETPVPIQATGTSEVRTGFSAAREGPLWRLSWDRAAVARLNPTGAVLSIRDGGKEQQIGLTPADLTSGTIMYTPQTGDLLFSLNIVMPGNQLAEEHVRVLGAPPSAQPPSASDLAEPVKIKVNQQVRTLRPFTPPTGRATSPASGRSSAADIPPPPAFSPSSPPASTTPVFTPLAAGAPVAPPNGAAPSSVLPPLSTPGSPQPLTIGPKPVHRATPSFSGSIPAGSATDVQIRVQIDTHGAVIKATPVASQNFVNFRLIQAATSAAREWVFEPARTDGHAVPSEMILEFHFATK